MKPAMPCWIEALAHFVARSSCLPVLDKVLVAAFRPASGRHFAAWLGIDEAAPLLARILADREAGNFNSMLTCKRVKLKPRG